MPYWGLYLIPHVIGVLFTQSGCNITILSPVGPSEIVHLLPSLALDSFLSHTCTSVISQKLKDSPSSDLWGSLSVQLPPLLYSTPQILLLSSSQIPNSVSFIQKDLWFYLGFLFLHCHLETLQEVIWGNHRANFVLVLSRITVLCCQLSNIWISLFHIFPPDILLFKIER